MSFDIDSYISILNSLSKIEEKYELGEQGASGGGESGGGDTLKRGSNWDELYALKRGKANMLGKKGEKWTTGLNRGVANQIW